MLKILAPFLLLMVGCSTFNKAPACYSSDTQLGLNDCAASQLEIASKELADATAKYSARLSSEQKVVFERSIAAWETYREATCRFEASGVEGGSAYPMPYLGCKASLTQDRIKYIATLSTCKEGHLSCPAW